MIETSKKAETAVLVHVAVSAVSAQEDIAEFEELAVSAGVKPLAWITAVCREPTPKYFIGQGKAEEIKLLVDAHKVSAVLINHPISATQERNLEKLLCCRVIDRTGLILDIFAARAKTFEGKLQVELAQHHYLSTRLVRGWTHLERQKGGIGLRGPGETQLETDRRLIRKRIQTLEKRLEKVSTQRNQNRQARKRTAVPAIALAGYTNAGKSTLFNTLTHAQTYTADKLFATLDPVLRRFRLDSGQPVVFADTVGFIRHLPHDLIAAFRATLLETREAHLLLHVIDANSSLMQDHIAQVNLVLKEIGAENIPQLEVYNKIDLMPGVPVQLKRNAEGRPAQIWISAEKKLGIDLLKQAISEIFI